MSITELEALYFSEFVYSDIVSGSFTNGVDMRVEIAQSKVLNGEDGDNALQQLRNEMEKLQNLGKDEEYNLEQCEEDMKNENEDIAMLAAEIKIYKEISEGSMLSEYSLLDVRDTNSSNGFVAHAYISNDRHLVVAFRGSESHNNQFLLDWVMADVGLAFSLDTVQQKAAQEYLEYIENTHGDKYDSVTFTGHSLGGNLAFNAATLCPDKMFGQIDKVYNLDGPGYTIRDMEVYSDRIDILNSGNKYNHYAATLVGTLFASDSVRASFVDPAFEDISKEHLLPAWLITLTEDNTFKEGKPTSSDLLLEAVAQIADNTSFYMENNKVRSAVMTYMFLNNPMYRATLLIPKIDDVSKYIDNYKEHEYENEQDIIDYLNKHVENKKVEYLVRGALLKCSAGTHARQLNLSKCHGVYIGEHPLIHAENNKVDENITFFGVCNAHSLPPTEEVSFQRDVERDSNGNKTGNAPFGFVKGNKCQPRIISNVWFDTYTGTQIVDNSDSESFKGSSLNEEMAKKAKPSTTTLSFLVCGYGGLIEPYNSGQQYPMQGQLTGTPNDDAPKIDEGMVHEKGSDETVYGSNDLGPFENSYNLNNTELSLDAQKYVDEMVTDRSYGNAPTAYNFEKIESLLTSETLEEDQVAALTYVFSSMKDKWHIEKFLNAGFVKDEMSVYEQMFYDEYYTSSVDDYYVPSSSLLAVKDYMQDNINTLTKEELAMFSYLTQIDENDGFYKVNMLYEYDYTYRSNEITVNSDDKTIVFPD
ncbi:MAG: Mbeg1-like protein [Eubacteriales bacterium]